MSKIVTFEQAKRLKKLGFNKECDDIYWTDGSKDLEEGYGKFDWNNQSEEPCISAPSVHEALDWIREEKRIACATLLAVTMNGDFIGYKGVYIDDRNTIYTDLHHTHPLASSALLDAVLTYLEKK